MPLPNNQVLNQSKNEHDLQESVAQLNARASSQARAVALAKATSKKLAENVAEQLAAAAAVAESSAAEVAELKVKPVTRRRKSVYGASVARPKVATATMKMHKAATPKMPDAMGTPEETDVSEALLQKAYLKLKAACASPITAETPLALFSMGQITGSVGAPTNTNIKDKRTIGIGRTRVVASAEVSLAGSTIDFKGFKKVVRQKLKIKSTDLSDR